MPVTPFHFGPGALVSVALPRYVSFLAFCAVNVLIDLESLRNMLTHQVRIHTFFHTYLGASLAAMYVILLFGTLRWFLLRRAAGSVVRPKSLAIGSITVGSLLGAWSHVALDSIMHADITPFAPWSQANSLFQVISTPTLHLACVAAGGLAAVWFGLRAKRAAT